MKHLKYFENFVCEEFELKMNFTPLYHVTSPNTLNRIFMDDVLKVGRPARGPLGICLTRSKYYTHDDNYAESRLILNRELLEIDGYKSYPVDEWALRNREGGRFSSKDTKDLKNRSEWARRDIKKSHFGKSQLPEIKSGKRGLRHGIESLPKKGMLGIEFEERILKDIKNLGKYIYAINVFESKIIDKINIEEYLKKYPHIKIMLGFDHPVDITDNIKSLPKLVKQIV